MLHWTPEGHCYRPGCNIYLTSTYARIVWFTFHPETLCGTTRYLRLRWKIGAKWAWALIRSTDSYDLIRQHLALRQLRVLTREQLEDIKVRLEAGPGWTDLVPLLATVYPTGEL